MGNWSVLYHWFEFNNEEDAKKAYQKLSLSYDQYEWIDKNMIGLEFGYISNTLIQAVTSQKYGLDKEFTYYIHNEFYSRSSAVNAGIDGEESFSILGNPITFVLSWDYFFLEDKNLNIENIIPTEKLKEFTILKKFNRKVLVIDKTYTFCKPFLNAEDIHIDPAVKKIVDLFQKLITQRDEFFKGKETEERIEIVFGRQDPVHGDVNFGVFTFFKEGDFLYETTGCYNILKDKQLHGEYLTPIKDEPKLTI